MEEESHSLQDTLTFHNETFAAQGGGMDSCFHESFAAIVGEQENSSFDTKHTPCPFSPDKN